MAEVRGGAQGQKYRISLGLPVGAVSFFSLRVILFYFKVALSSHLSLTQP